MPLGIEVGLGPGDFVLHGDPAPPPKRAQPSQPIFGLCLLWQNGYRWIKTPLIGTEIGLGPGDVVLDGDPAPS